MPHDTGGALSRTLLDLLSEQAGHHGDAAAILTPGQTAVSHHLLGRQIERTVAQLSALGVRSSARIATLLPDGPEPALAVLSISAIASCLPLNPAVRAMELETILRRAQPQALLVLAGTTPHAVAVARRLAIPLLHLQPRAGTSGLFDVSGDLLSEPTGARLSQADDAMLVLQTSGTSAEPKLVTLRHRHVLASTLAIRWTLELTKDDRCLSVMPLFHIHGLSAIFASLAAGGSAVCPAGFSATAFFDWLEEFRPTWFTASPTIHRAILEAGRRHRPALHGSSLRFLRSASAPMPRDLARELEDFFDVPLLEAYGMTEASPQIASNRLPPHTRKPGSVGKAAGPELVILTSDSDRFTPLPNDCIGEIAIRGDNVCVDGWLRTGDLGYLDAGGDLFVTGRVGDTINRGGEKIAPQEIEAALLAHPSVRDAVAFPVPHPTLGERVAAIVVPQPETSTTPTDFRQFLALRLAWFKVPQPILLVEELPVGPTGKLQRKQLAQQLGLASPAFGSAAVPVSEAESFLLSVFADVLRREELGTEDDFFEAGGDSLSAMQVIARLNDALSIDLAGDALFEHPTVRALAARIEAAPVSPGRSQPTRLEHGDRRPLSLAQQRLWVLEQLEPDTAAYNMQVALRLQGALRMDALEDSLRELVRRHEVLRTTIDSEGGQPFARPHDSSLRLPLISLARIPSQVREDELQRLAVEERARPFVLAREIPFRALLVQSDAADHVLLLTMHHIVSDGWSTAVLLRELSALYRSFVEERPPENTELGLQYADVAVWQKQLLDTGVRDAQLAYWREALADIRTDLDLPADRPASAMPSHAGATWEMAIDRSTLARLEQLGRDEGATIFMTMLAAFQTLLFRYSGQEDLAVGAPIANRTHPATEEMIGFFANTLVLRADLSGDPSFRALLRRVRQTALGAFAHQDLPFDDLVDALRPARQGTRSPLFQVMFAFQNLPRWPEAFGPELTATSYPVAGSTAKFDLTLYLSAGPDGLRAVWQYAKDRFDESTIAGMAASYQTLLASILEDPDTPLSALPLCPQPALSITDATSDPPSFLERFAANVERTPEAIAVRCGDETLSYRALDHLANALSARLRARGVSGGTMVGVCMARSVHALVALLAVWKARAVYVPIDPTYPTERIRFLLHDAHVTILVTARAVSDSLPETAASVLCIDDDAVAQASQSTQQEVTSEPASQTPAYVIYTSGSTGPPKGVLISHRNVAHYVGAMLETLGITAEDRYLHTAPFTFSSAMRQFLLPLACGATVVLAQSEELLDPRALFERIRAADVTVTDFVPSYWRQLLRSLSALPSSKREALLDNKLRLLLSASETLLSDLPAQWAAWGHPTRLVNMYGQTETTGILTTCEISAPDLAEPKAVPIGRAIPRAEVHVVDSQGRLVPAGVVGELLVAGPTVGLGYLERPEETAQRFVPHGADRAYRTGDRARRCADGTLTLCGRVDAQMKVRGFRIEPGEIEAALRRDAHVEECAVIARELEGETRVEAFVVPRHGLAASESSAMAATLRGALTATLPSYLVPSSIRIVDTLPLTPTGKVHRAALGREDRARHNAPEHDRAALPAESLLSELWCRLLSLPHVRHDDNFFDLGGDSLTGIRMIHEANVAGLALTPQDLFRHQTLGALARAASSTKARIEVSASVPDAMMRITVESARRFGEEALMQGGLSAPDAARMTEVQVEASLRGQPTHNIGAIPRYARRLAARTTNPRPEFRIERETGVSALLDADNGPGQLAALTAMQLATEKAARNGVGVVGVRRSNHFGAAGHYVWEAARQNLIGLCTTNSALWLAPTGAVTPLFGTNPLAVGIPASRHHPIVLDVSMSVTAKGKVARRLEEGHALPPGWIFDSSGQPSVDPADLVAGLGIPIGAHKGYGLALVMEVLSGVLTGSGFALDHRRERLKRGDVHADFGHFFLAIDPGLFLSREEFFARVDRMIDEVKAAKRMSGVDEILLPGEAELRAREANLRGDFPISRATYEALEKYGREAGLHTRLAVVEEAASEDALTLADPRRSDS